MSQSQDDLFRQATEAFGPALDRLVHAYELDADKRCDLLQEVFLSLWRSFEHFEGRCSLRTWVYRVAHNTSASYVIRQRRSNAPLMSLEDMDAMPKAPGTTDRAASIDVDARMALDRLLQLIHQLKPPDRELMLLYLEDLDATTIGEVMGISPGNVRVQIHRIKAILARRFHAGGEA